MQSPGDGLARSNAEDSGVARQPDVSVIIAAYNACPYVAVTLDSLARQTLGMRRMEIIAVDDGSTDATPELLEDFASRNRSVTVIRQANSGGPSQPRNTAIERATGRFIFCLDADDYLSPDALKTMVDTADSQKTDVVLARMRGTGGRGTPRLPYMRTALHTDVFNSAAYWSLNPMKLFRTDLVRREGLRFEHALSRFEDQPFVAGGLLGARGLSVLSDHDYVFWTRREDEGNITYAKVSLSDRMPVLERMFTLVADRVPPGPGRDKLLRRHFLVELIESAFVGYQHCTDEAQRAEAFAEFARVVDTYMTPAIERGLFPVPRLLLESVRTGDHEGFGLQLDAVYGGGLGVRVEAPHVFVDSPELLRAAGDASGEDFDIAARLRPDCRLERIEVSGRGLHVRAECRLGELTGRVDGASLVIRRASDAREITVPLDFRIDHEVVRDRKRPYIAIDATLSAHDVLAHLVPGAFKVFIRLCAAGICRDARAVECALPPRPGRVFGDAGAGLTGRLVTLENGQLGLNVKRGLTGALKARVKAVLEP